MHKDEPWPFCDSQGNAIAIAALNRPELTYDQLADQVKKSARALRAAGFERTDRVALVLPDGPEAATAFLSIANACICAPLNPAYRASEFDFHLRDICPRAIAVAEDGPATEVASRLGIEVIRVVWTSDDPAGVFRLAGLRFEGNGDFIAPSPDDTALLLHTSGTTSRPKLVPLTWGNLSQAAANISRTLGLSASDRCLDVMPLFHIHGLVAVLLSSLSAGASVVCTPGFLSTDFFDWLDIFAPTWYSAVPTMHQSVLARAPAHPETLARVRLRFIRSSSAALPVRVLEELESTFGSPVIEAYGMTEASHQMASNPLPPGIRKKGSVGPAAGSKISVRDETFQLLPSGVTGHIWVAGPNVTSGYLESPGANHESFVDGWFCTGDVGWLDEDGYLFLSGRSKEIINRGGEKISPREVDEVLMRHPAVRQCLAFALPDSRLGEEVGAAVVLKPGAPSDEAAIQSFAASLLADFNVPRRIYFLDEIPKGPTGKPQRIGLAGWLGIKEDGWKPASTSTVSATPADPTVVAGVSAIMAEVLRLGSAGPDTNFFDAGGDSLLGTRFVARLENEYHCAFTLVDLFQASTPNAIAGRVSAPAVPAEPEMEPVRDSHAGGALSFGQVRLWFLDTYEPGSLAYVRPYLIEIRGEIDAERVRTALIRIVERHEPLRTMIENHEGNPKARIRAAEPLPLEIRDWRAAATGDAAAMEACREEAARPFRLDSDLPLRASLHRIEDRRWWLLVVIHHVATDGWSARILVRELGELLRGRALAPDPLPVTYSDFARWQERFLSGERLENLVGYWHRRLDGVPGSLDLPLDFLRPDRQTFRGRLVSATLPLHLTARLREVSQQCGATLFMTLLAGWKALLARLCGATDICVGVPVAGRSRVEWEPLIGLFMNTLALRSKLDGDPTFREILDRVRETCLQAWRHQDLPFEKLVQALGPERNLAHTPYFQVFFQLRNFPEFHPEASGPSLRQLDIDLDTVPNDLSLEITGAGDGLICRLFFNTALFTESSAVSILERFEILLRGAAEAPDKRLSGLPLLTAGERKRLLVDWNATESLYPRDQCIHQLFEEQAERTPESVAVVLGDRVLTYRELNQRANQLAHHLRDLGVKPEDLVGICLDRSLEMVVGLLGILKAGGAWVPMDPAYPRERLGFILRDTQAAIVLTQAGLRQRLPEDSGIVCLDADWQAIAKAKDENPNLDASAGNLAYVMYTSGSTGTPKGVEIPHRGVVRLLCGTNYASLTADEVFLQLAPLAFDASTFEIWGALLHGARLVLMPPEQATPKEIGEAIRKHKITTLWLTAGLFHLMVEERISDLKPLRQLLAGGDVLSSRHVHQALRELGCGRLINGYGPTESTTFACCYRVESETDRERPVPIGRPIANTQIYILDAHLQPVPVGVTGELCIGGDGLARGYRNRPELTAEKFIAHPFSAEPGARIYRTGDLARYRPDGNVEFLGRMDHQVKIRGFRIELEEIEAVVQQHPGVSQCVAAALEDAAGEKRLAAWVVVADPQSPPAITGLREFLKQKLPDYMVPAAIVILPNLPLTPNGKIDRKALPKPDVDAYAVVRYEAPEGKTERALAAIWADLLNLERIGRNDDFFDSGGHSLLATRLVSRLRDVFEIEIPLRTFFEYTTIAALAGYLKGATGAGALSIAPPIPPVSRTQDLPLSFAQQRLWLLDRLKPGSAAYNIPIALHLEGAVDAELLQRCLSEVVRRHEALRTRFETAHGNPVQVIEAPDGLPMPLTDLSHLPEAERGVQATQLCMEEARRPFNLSHAPVLRARLIQLRPTSNVLMLNVHHIAADAWSIEILLRELGILYQAFCQGNLSPLPELPIQYADFAVWQRNHLEEEVLEKQLSHWREQLDNTSALLELPTDRSRPAVSTGHGAIEEIVLPGRLLTELKTLSHGEGATLFMTLLAGFQTLLSRYSGQRDLAVGVPIAGRDRKEIEGLIGFFVNMVVLRCDLTGNPTFRGLLRRVREAVLEAFTHQDLPFERLVQGLRPIRAMNYSPLFQVVFGMENTPATPARLGDLDLRVEWMHSGTAKFDLSVQVTEEANGLRAVTEYSTDLFERETILRMLASFRTLLESVVANPDEPIESPLMVPPAERKRLLVDWNATESLYPRDRCIHQLFEEQAERTPESVAVVLGDRVLTYRELNQRANQLAHHLRDLGVKPEDLVGICLERSLEMVVGLLGILKAGGAWVPMDPAYPRERLGFILRDTQAAIVLTQAGLRQRLPEDSGIVCLDADWQAIAKAKDENPNLDASAGNLAYVMYTSGSTGTPKGVEIPHRGVVRLLCGTNYASLTADEVFLQLAPLAFDASTFEIWGALLHGARLVLMPPEQATPKEIGEAIRKHKITTLWLTAGLFHLMVEERISDLKPLRQLLAGGDVLSSRHVHQALRELGCGRLINGYGPTESTTFACCYRVESETDRERPVPIGRPIANTQIYILDAHLQPVPVGVTGELCIGGDGLARGYRNRPELTAEKFIAHPFSAEPGARIYRTGDLARYRPDGNVEFLGRMDHQVKIRGFRIELEEIEAVVQQHPGVSQCVAAALEDAAGEKRLAAWVVVADPQSPPAITGLREFLKQKLPDYMVPAAIVILPNLPLTPNGKVDRKALPKEARSPAWLSRGQQCVDFRTLLELQLAQIWERILGVSTVSVHDNFFALGGHSLMAVRLIGEIQESLRRSLPLPVFFQNPTIEAMAKVLQTDDHAPAEPQLIPLQPGGLPGALFLLDAGIGLCRLAQLLYEGPPSFATVVPITSVSLRAATHGKTSELPSLHELAAPHATLIRCRQPFGPCVLVGHSFGGLLAFEVAHQLQTKGGQVEMILLLDSWAMIPPWWKKLKLWTPDRIRNAVHVRTRRLGSRIRPKVGNEEGPVGAFVSSASPGTAIAHPNQPFGEVPWNIREKVYQNAWDNYRCRQLDSRAVLFRSRDSRMAHLHVIDGNLGWSGLFTRGLEVVDSSGGHTSLLKAPHVETLAGQIRKYLEQPGNTPRNENR